MTTEAVLGRDDQQIPERITREDLRPGTLSASGTEIILQRHGEYVRDPEDPRVGSLTAEAAETESQASVAYFDELLHGMSEEERASVDILVVASDTQYRGGGRRSLETATIVQDAAQAVLAQYELDPAEHLINLHHPVHNDDGPRTKPMLREPHMFNESPEFVKFLEEKYGNGREFWVAFEEDKESETRQQMGAEGPDEITDRMEHAMAILNRYSRQHHAANPDRRLVIWVATHYDTISPYVKRDVLGVDKTRYVGVDYGAGVVIDIDAEGTAQTTLGGQRYPVDIK
jgi:hypothetical protein